MPRRNGFFNWTLAIVLVTAVIVFIGAVLLVHSLRRSTRTAKAEQALPVGEQAYAQKDWDQAADQLGRYLSIHSDDTAVLLKYADAQLKRRPISSGSFQQAVSAYRSVLRLDRNNQEATKRLVEVYLASGSPGEATMVASDFVKNNDDPALKRLLAVCLAQQPQRFSDAITTLEELISRHPDDVLAYELMGRLAEQRSAGADKSAAQKWFDQAVAANPQSALAHTVRGAFYLLPDHRDRDKALAEFEEAEKLDLSDTDVHLRLVQELIRAQVFDKAKTHLTALRAAMSTEPTFWQCWAAVALANGTAEERATVAEDGLKELAAQPWDFMPAAVELFVAAGQSERASQYTAQMQQRGLQQALITFLEGLVAGGKGESRKAIGAWQRAIEQGYKVHRYAGGMGAVVPVRMMIASSLVQLRDVQSAIMQLRSLVTETPSYVEGRLALARLLIQTRDWAGALDQASEVQKIIPAPTEARKIDPRLAEALLVELQARVFLLSQSDSSSPGLEQAWQDVEKRLTQIDQAMGGSVPIQMLLARAAIGRGKQAEAAQLLEQIQGKDPSNTQAALLRVELFNDQGKPDEAISLLRKAVEQSPQAVELVRMLALLLNQQKDQAGCEAVVKEAMARVTPPEAKQELGSLMADFYRFWAREDDLYRWLTDLAEQFPANILTKRQLLACRAVAKDPQQAQALVDQIKSIEGETGWQWRYEQAKIWIASDGFAARYSDVVGSLQENLTANPDDQASRLLLAMAHEKAGQSQLALSLYREALGRSPNNIEVIMRTVAALYRTGAAGQYGEAERILKQAADRQLYHPDIEKLELYGKKLRWQDEVRRGALGSASDVLQQIIKQDPNDVSASLWLALISMQQDKLDEADVILKDLRARSPESMAVIQAQVRLCILQKNVSEALRLCNETVQKRNDAPAYILRASTYASIRENDKAIADFDQAAAKDPDNADIWTDRAGFYLSIGLRQEANRDIRKALGLAHKSAATLDRVIPLCLASGSRALVRDAEVILDAARKTDPNSPSLKVLKGQFLLAKGTGPSIEQGRQLLRQVTADRPELSQAWLLLGRLQLGEGQVGEASNTALVGLSHNEGDKQLLLLKADAEAARSPALAVSTLTPLVQTYPDDLDVSLRLASALYKSGSKSDAQSLIESRMKAEPNNPAIVVAWTGLLASDRRWTDVTGQVTNWTRRHPNDTAVVSAVARSLMSGGETEGLKIAESLLKADVVRHPQSTQVVGAYALLMQSLSQMDDAAVYYQKAIELDPNDVIALNNLAWILCEENKRYQDALGLAERGLKIAPDYADLIDTRGVACYRLGRFEQATADFAKCIEIYPANARSLAAAHFHMARACAKMAGRATQAEQHVKQAIDLGGLSSEDLIEATQLREQLQKGR